MCGISGFWGRPDGDLLTAMTGVICHRGPDDHGSVETDVASLGSRRLSIIDLAGGHQPMESADGALQIVYNGEVYNFRELRAELEGEGHAFRTDCDTEVVLRAYETWGVDSFRRLNGMWGLAILDRRDAAAPKLVLCRDHFGIKPLYWTALDGRILFSSEIKGLIQDRSLTPRPNEQRVYEYLAFGLHDHDRDTFFAGIRQLAPATYALVTADGVSEHTYWEPRLSSDGDPSPGRFRELFERSVQRRLVADVPVGTCLSGGLDSSSIVCIMSRQLREHAPDSESMGERLKTFSAVFPGDPIDERAYIEHVLKASDAEGNFVAPTPAEFTEELPRFVWYLDEPMVSSGPYAQWSVMRLAAGKVKVLLDGQGGDELLAGYTPYQYVYLRQLLRERRFGLLAREAMRARDVLWPHVRRRVGKRPRAVPIRGLLRRDFLARVRRPRDPRVRDDLKLRLLQDLTAYSLPSLLRYDDRNSMAHSVESRVPFLDQELVEHVLSLPAEAIIRNGWSRAILRDAMRGVLPERIRRRRWKVGFTTPEFRWIRAERAFFEDVLRSESFRSRPYWDGDAVARSFAEALDGRAEESLFFWRAINVEIWHRVFFDRDGRSDPAAGVAEADGAAAVALDESGEPVAAVTG
ncbi:MAG TPA: asparagine synthase (glutamine-hydrolyzing) [Candidatus Limnocylindria bacterium]|nr:asparagine synthase (glutamine-hydrolyzing) [Candidatus Limnocylindria bacterium]